MSTRFLSSLLVLLYSFPAWAWPDHILHKPYLEKLEVVDSVTGVSYSIDSAQVAEMIAGYIDWAEKNNDNELALMFSFVPLKTFVNLLRGEEYENDMLEKLRRGLKKGYVYAVIDGYHTLGRKTWELRHYSKAMEYELKAYDLYKDLSLKELPRRADYQHSLAIKYYAFKDYERTKQLLLDLKHADSRPLYEILGGSEYNSLALAYTKLEQYDSAIHAFTMIYNNEMLRKDYGLAAIAAGNMGNVYYLQEDYDNAIKWLQEEYRVSETFKKGYINLNIANSHILMAEMFTIKKMPEEASRALNIATEYLAISGKVPFGTQKSYYLAYARLMALQNRMGEAYRFLDSSRFFSDSAMAEFDKAKLMEAEVKIDKVNHELKLQELEHNRETSVFIRNTAIIIITLLSAIALLMINRSRLRHKQRQELLAREKEKAELELNSARVQLDKFTRNIHEKNKLIEQFTEEIDKLQVKERSDDRNETLLKLQSSTILTDDEWDEFRQLFEKVHSGFLNRLKEKYSEITPAETRYLALTKLNLSNKEMANLLGTGTTAVRNYKYRLRKKLGLPDDDSFDEMIRNI